MWEPMAIAILFGLTFATVLTLGLVGVRIVNREATGAFSGSKKVARLVGVERHSRSSWRVVPCLAQGSTVSNRINSARSTTGRSPNHIDQSSLANVTLVIRVISLSWKRATVTPPGSQRMMNLSSSWTSL